MTALGVRHTGRQSATSVLLDVRAASAGTQGIARYARTLAHDIPASDPTREYRYFCWPRRVLRWRPLTPGGLTVNGRQPLVTTPIPGRALHELNLRHALRAPRLGVGSASLLHSFDFVPVFFKSIPTIATIHDVAYLKMPESVRANDFATGMDNVVRRVLPLCAAVIAVSEQSKADIVEVYHYPPERVHVVYNWIPEELIRADAGQTYRLPTDAPYILAVGTVQPHKNYHGAIAALALIARQVPHSLVIAGNDRFRPDYTDSLRRQAHSHGIGDRVHFAGPVDDATLASMYRGSDLLHFPSFYEGFGYPLIEAMHFGVPIVAATGGSMPEVAGDAALLVPPSDEAAMAGAIEAAVTDRALRARLIDLGRERLQRFSKERAVAGILAVYAAVGG